ncbi:MAG: hypothetical protein R3D26_12565 [Cyanobacteriota/Melainabacteria group bacterium]
MSQIYLFLPSIQKAFWLQPHSLPTYSFLGPADSTGLPTMIARWILFILDTGERVVFNWKERANSRNFSSRGNRSFPATA